jgi:uncharacterized protein YciI
MQFIYILQLTPAYTEGKNWTTETEQILGQHFNYLKALYEQGVVKFVGKTEYGIEHPDNRGITVFEAENQATADRIMQNDPCVINGIMTAVVHPFRIAFN